jgi:uncharacterized protein YlxW (UPF0749 family)
MSTPRRVDASMSLLNDLMRQPVDGDYAAAHAAGLTRKVSRPQRLTRSGLVLVVAVALGLVLSGAVVNLRAPTAALRASRQLLIDQVSERTAHADALASANADLSAQVTTLQAEALAAADPALLERLSRYEVASGSAPVVGPGLVFELSDAPVTDGVPNPESRVQDIDLQVLVNGLWAAGAEAVAVNGVRLTALSAIRTAGQAILVDLVPLSSPYTVSAIGDPQQMQTRFAQGSAAGHLALLTSTYDIGVSTHAATDLQLPGSGPITLRHAQVPDVASSEPQDETSATTVPSPGGTTP